ncbi:MAG: YicC/YloC family endoribonuclease, partial [Oscillospiraceae bacterium]
GRAQNVGDKWDISVEIKSVNHRYFEFSSKSPKAFLFLEDKLKSMVQDVVSRGKVEGMLSIYNVGKQDVQTAVNREVASGYVNALREAAPELGLSDDLKLSDLLRFSDIFTLKRLEIDEDELWRAVSEVAKSALEAHISMKKIEGAKLREDVQNRLASIEKLLSQVEERAPMLRQEYHDRLLAKLSEVLADKNIDESRLAIEAAIFADKVAIDEETVRLRSHLAQFYQLLEMDEPVGKKLDFLVQECNREVNTIGSKAQDMAITRVVIDMKAEMEKIREQIQNIE